MPDPLRSALAGQPGVSAELAALASRLAGRVGASRVAVVCAEGDLLRLGLEGADPGPLVEDGPDAERAARAGEVVAVVDGALVLPFAGGAVVLEPCVAAPADAADLLDAAAL